MKTLKLMAAMAFAGGVAMGATQLAHADAAAPEVIAETCPYSADSTVGELLDNPAAKAVFVKHVPEIGEDDQIEMARPLSLRSLQNFAPDAFTDELLEAIDADLADVPCKTS